MKEKEWSNGTKLTVKNTMKEFEYAIWLLNTSTFKGVGGSAKPSFHFNDIHHYGSYKPTEKIVCSKWVSVSS